MINNVALMFSPTDEKTPLRAERESYGHTVQSVAGRSIVHKSLERSTAWTKPERVLMGLM